MARTQLLCPVLPVVYGEQAKSSSGLDLISRVLQERRILLLLRCWGQHFPDGAGQVWQPCRIQGDAIAVLLDVLPGPTPPARGIPILRLVRHERVRRFHPEVAFTEGEQRQWDRLFSQNMDEAAKEQLGALVAASRECEVSVAIAELREPDLRYPAIAIDEVRSHIEPPL